MSRGSSGVRDELLDSYARVVIEQGERAATLECVAEAAGVSKGGLLYHFGSKNALLEGLIDRTVESVRTEIAGFGPRGFTAHFIDSSPNNGSRTDRALSALIQLALQHEAARLAMLRIEELWGAAVVAELGDEALARLVMLLSDGIYFLSLFTDRSSQDKVSMGIADAKIALARLGVDLLEPAESR